MSKKNYRWAAETFATARDPRAGKPLENNTRLFRRADDCYAVRLHATDVVTYWDDGRVTLDTGGWQTMTTRDRIEGYAPIRIHSDRGVWYVTHARGAGPVPYFNGITFGPRGKCLNGPSPARWAQHLRDRAAMDRRIQTYCTAFNRALAREGLSMPGSGDCWFCSLGDAAGTPLGDLHADHGHLVSHMEEGYYVPTLAVNALRAKGYRDAAIAYYLAMDPESDRMGGPGSRYQASDGSMGGNTVRRALLAYMRDRLLPVAPGPNADQRAPVRAVNRHAF